MGSVPPNAGRISRNTPAPTSSGPARTADQCGSVERVVAAIGHDATNRHNAPCWRMARGTTLCVNGSPYAGAANRLCKQSSASGRTQSSKKKKCTASEEPPFFCVCAEEVLGFGFVCTSRVDLFSCFIASAARTHLGSVGRSTAFVRGFC